jgi:hypothetical protein
MQLQMSSTIYINYINKPDNFLELACEISGMNCQEHPSNGSRDMAENVHFCLGTVHLIINISISNIQWLWQSFVECNVGMFMKIPAIRSYIQLRRPKVLLINGHKLLIDRSQTYMLLIAWASCAGINCQDNINTELEIQRRWHTVLLVRGVNYWHFAVRLTTVVVNMCVVSDVKLQKIRNMDVQTAAMKKTFKWNALKYWPIAAERTKFVANMRGVAGVIFQECSSNRSLIAAEMVQVSASEVPLIIDWPQPTM